MTFERCWGAFIKPATEKQASWSFWLNSRATLLPMPQRMLVFYHRLMHEGTELVDAIRL